MTKPRSHYVDPEHARFYHVTSRCVRRAWLLGVDPLTGVNHTHRKTVFLNRLRYLARFFAVDVMGYAIMSNHVHLVLHYDPKASERWTDEEVAERWCAVFRGHPITDVPAESMTAATFDMDQTIRYHTLLLDGERLARCREALGSLSRFMQHLKQPFSVWANREEGCKGYFFERRFYSGVLLTEDDLLACMAYVDLNPVEAGISRSLRDAKETSVHERLDAHRFSVDHMEAYLAPLWADAEDADLSAGPETTSQRINIRLSCTLKTYVHQLNLAIAYFTHPSAEIPSGTTTWMARLLNRERRQRVPEHAFYDYA